MKKVIYVDSLSHHGVKGMKWGVRKVKKYANKAKRQSEYDRKLGNDIKKHGDWDDDEFLGTLTRKEQKQEWSRSNKVAKRYLQSANYWDLAYKDISSSKSNKEAKEKLKTYRRNSPNGYNPGI